MTDTNHTYPERPDTWQMDWFCQNGATIHIHSIGSDGMIRLRLKPIPSIEVDDIDGTTRKVQYVYEGLIPVSGLINSRFAVDLLANDWQAYYYKDLLVYYVRTFVMIHKHQEILKEG